MPALVCSRPPRAFRSDRRDDAGDDVDAPNASKVTPHFSLFRETEKRRGFAPSLSTRGARAPVSRGQGTRPRALDRRHVVRYAFRRLERAHRPGKPARVARALGVLPGPGVPGGGAGHARRGDGPERARGAPRRARASARGRPARGGRGRHLARREARARGPAPVHGALRRAGPTPGDGPSQRRRDSFVRRLRPRADDGTRLRERVHERPCGHRHDAARRSAGVPTARARVEGGRERRRVVRGFVQRRAHGRRRAPQLFRQRRRRDGAR